MTAAEEGNTASMVRDSKTAPVTERPCPLAIADSIKALGIPCFFAAVIEVAR